MILHTRRVFSATAAVFLAVLLAGAVPAAGQAGIVQQVGSVTTDAGAVVIEDVTDGLTHPWGMDFLPGGERLLVTERSGDLHVLNMNTGALSGPVEGTPTVFAQGQGGMLDVAVGPNFQESRYVYLSFSEPGSEGSASTALGRGRMPEGSNRLEDFEVLFRQQPKIVGPNHFGGRIVFSNDGEHLFLTMGERFQFEPAQDSTNTLGTIARLNLDGSVPEGNPFVGQGGEDEIWSFGHRNIESATIHPETGRLWIAEMGPLGGDELNQPQAGRNYGWPTVSWGQDYDGADIPDPPTHPRFADAVIHWTPVISPSGMAFYTGDQFPEWQGSALIGSLSDQSLVRVEIDGGQATEAERIPMEGARIRSVDQGPDGNVYVLTDQDDGNVWRVRPLEQSGR